MLIFFFISLIVIFGLNSLLRRAIDDYEYGGGSFREWREFESAHKQLID